MYWNRKSTKVITPPSAATRIISVDEMKDYLRVDTTDDDTLIGELIDTATEMARDHTRRAILEETLELTMDGFSDTGIDETRLGRGVHDMSKSAALGYGDEFNLPFPPIVSITSIKTFSTDNTESTYDSAKYELDETGGRVYLNQSQTWPVNLRDREAVKVRYIAGYGSSATGIPLAIKQAIRQHTAAMYECRQACEMPKSCKALLSPYKLLDGLGY